MTRGQILYPLNRGGTKFTCASKIKFRDYHIEMHSRYRLLDAPYLTEPTSAVHFNMVYGFLPYLKLVPPLHYTVKTYVALPCILITLYHIEAPSIHIESGRSLPESCTVTIGVPPHLATIFSCPHCLHHKDASI